MNKTKMIFCRVMSACCLMLLFPVIVLADTGVGLALSPEFRRPLFLSQNIEVREDQDADRPGFGKRAFRDLSGAVKITLSDVKHIYTAPARMDVRHALWLGGILAVGGVIFAYDQEIYDALKRNEDHKFYKPIRDAGEFFEPLGYMGFTNKFLFAALAIGYVARIEPMIAIPRDVLEHFLVASFGKNTMMVLSGRKGPMIEEGPRSRTFNDGRSFPSGHSLAITQLASVLSHHTDYVPLKVAAYGMAGTVLLQRITSDHHWPSDVYGGAFFGWLVSRELLKRKEERNIKITPVTWDGEKGAGLMVTFGF
ncbi:MAG: phosphatase PAP2 family protein, partial [Candidatus Latescibacteria bacterium]|nr:phosphatase PAP2 family protein [Candidatus Latescibacterota bacterium]